MANTKLVIKILDLIEEVYKNNQTFGNYNENVIEGDRNFTFKDWLLMYKTVPKIRGSLIIGLFVKVFFRIFKPNKTEINNFSSIKFTPGKKNNFFHRGTYGDLIVIESYLIVSESFGLLQKRQPSISKVSESLLKIIAPDGRLITDKNSNKLMTYSYYPQHNHLVSKNHPMYKYFDVWDVTCPENDSTAVVYSCFQTIRNLLNINIVELENHNKSVENYANYLYDYLRGEGLYGKEKLCYETGFNKTDSGVLTWILEKHNELDPTVNINILSYLASLMGNGMTNKTIYYLSNQIIKFLFDLANRDLLLQPRVQIYYPIGSVYFLWYRFLYYKDRINSQQLAFFDNGKHINKINEHFKNKVLSNDYFHSNELNSNDKILISPFILREKLISEKTWKLQMEPLLQNNYFRNNYFHFCHTRYPFKVICTINMLPFCAYLYSYMEMENSNRNRNI